MQDWLKSLPWRESTFPGDGDSENAHHILLHSRAERFEKINTKGVRRSELDVEELCTFFEQKLRCRKLSTSVFRLLQRAHSQEWQRLWLPQFQDVARFGSGCF